jgi:hypothetical protein
MFGVRLLRVDQRTQREILPLKEEMVSSMWEIAEVFKLEHVVGSRAFARVRLGSDPSLLLRMTMREIRWMFANYCRACRRKGAVSSTIPGMIENSLSLHCSEGGIPAHSNI